MNVLRTFQPVALLAVLACCAVFGAEAPVEIFPASHWQTCSPKDAGLSETKLAALTNLVGGRGCVVRHGRLAFTWGDQSKSSDVASAFKPLLSTLLWMAIDEWRLASPDALVTEFEPRLKTLNDGKDAAMTWRHLASQTSGYGLSEKPGEAYSYNDFALALYYDTLTERVFGTNGTEVLRTRLAEPLQFEDHYSFNAFGANNRPGRLALSCRDFARFGLLMLRQGRWGERQLMPASAFVAMTNSLVPAGFPLTSGRETAMLPKQRSIGGTRNITPVGPGYYSFNWWLNQTNAAGQRLWPGAPPDTFAASGHGGMRVLFLIPSLDLIVCWNDGRIDDHDKSPGNPATKMNQAARLIREAVLPGSPAARLQLAGHAAPENTDPPASRTTSQRPPTVLGVRGTQFTVNGQPTFLSGISYVAPVHYQEPFRRGYGKFDPGVSDFITDANNAKVGGAAGWCFHNGDTRAAPDGRPRRSFDLREKRLFDALDAEERKTVEALKQVVGR